MRFFVLTLSCGFISTSVFATTPPSCFKPCLYKISEWGEGGVLNVTNICSNHLSLVGCLVDICEEASLSPAKTHFLGTCKSKNIDYELITNSTTSRLINENGKPGENSESQTDKNVVEKESTGHNSAKINDLTNNLQKLNEKTEPDLFSSHGQQENSRKAFKITNEYGSAYGISSPLKLMDYIQNDDRTHQVLQKNKPGEIYQNADDHTIDYRSRESSRNENYPARNQFDDDEIQERTGQKVDAKLVSNNAKEHDIKNYGNSASNRSPEPVVKFYKTHQRTYDSDGIEIDDFTGFSSKSPNQNTKNKNYRYVKNQPAVGSSEFENSKAANHMPMLDDE